MTRSFSPWIDLPLALLIYAVVLASVFYWVHGDKQQIIEKTPKTTRGITFRLGLVISCLFVGCYATNIAFWFVGVIAVLLVLAVGAGDVLGILVLPFLGLGYLLKEFVLGFPELLLSPPDDRFVEVSSTGRFAEFLERLAITTGPCLPQGEIEIDEGRFPAISDSGMMIDSGKPVRVTGERNGSLLVRAIE